MIPTFTAIIFNYYSIMEITLWYDKPTIYSWIHTHIHVCKQTEEYINTWMWTDRDRDRDVGCFHGSGSAEWYQNAGFIVFL